MDINCILSHEKNVRSRVISNSKVTISLCILPCTLMFVIQFILSFFSFSPNGEISYFGLNMLLYCLIIIPPFALSSFLLRRLSFTSKTTQKHNSIKFPLLFIFGTIGIGIIANLLLTLLLPNFVAFYAQSKIFLPKTSFGILFFFIANAVLPAIIEEWAFRGIICKNLLPYGNKSAIIISAFLFSIVHVDPPSMIITFIIGILLGVCYIHTGTLKMPMAIHFLNNALSSVIALCSNTGTSILVLINAVYIYLMIIGVIAIIYYSVSGLSTRKFSLNAPICKGYTPSFGLNIKHFLFNFNFLPLCILYAFFYYVSYVLVI